VRNLIEPEASDDERPDPQTSPSRRKRSLDRAEEVAQQQGGSGVRVRQREQEAEQARALARGEADAARIRAEGEAAALSLINEQLSQNPLLLQWRYIESLGPNVQMMIIPSNSPFLFDLESLTAQSGTPIPTPAAPGGTD